ncbi:MAG: hypothetical protein HQK77_14445 [Desulfobacterales bacterium]|nr:hypothetical protein [Desulfobacterales bacterium]
MLTTQSDKMQDRRIYPRTIIDKFYSVQFMVKGLNMTYQFKLWDTSHGGVCFLVKETSPVLEYLHVGDIIEMKYYTIESGGHPDHIEQCKTQIRHITKDNGRFKGHYMIGFSIVQGGNS